MVTEQIKGMEDEKEQSNEKVSEFGQLVKWLFYLQESGE